jgi:hypothetical protein
MMMELLFSELENHLLPSGQAALQALKAYVEALAPPSLSGNFTFLYHRPVVFSDEPFVHSLFQVH